MNSNNHYMCRFLNETECHRGTIHAGPDDCCDCRQLECCDDPAALRKALRDFCLDMRGREGRLREEKDELAHGFTRVIEMVSRLSAGDPSARIEVGTDDTNVSELAEMLNSMAGNMQEMVNESHEMAVGLCEHYDTLNKLSQGDFTALASTDSPNDLIAKLGMLINHEAKTLLDKIAELQRTDDELKTAYQQLQDIIEFLPDATFVVDQDHRVIAWNRAIEELTGFSKEIMIGKGDYAYSIPFYGEPCRVLIDFLDSEEEIAARYSYIERKGASLFAETFLQKFKGGAHLWLTASPLYDSNGTRVGAIESVRDISDFKRAQQQRGLLETQLRQAQKMESIGQMASGIAHDFNNVLAAIIGYSYMLKTKSGDAEQSRHYAAQILTASEKATKLTRDLLAFSRKQIITREPTDINRSIVPISDMLGRLIGEDIELRIELCEEQLVTLVDDVHIQQVVMNLVTNARDAMPDGGSITISSRGCRPTAEQLYPHQMPQGPYAFIEVRDTGTGMDVDTKERIFEPFFTTKEMGKGTGLGLAIVYGIVKQFNGFLEICSEVGSGTAMQVYLPIADGRPGAREDAHQAAIPFASGGGETVLLAEDNQITRDVYRDILADAGYKVITADDGDAAVELFARHADEIGVVMLDLVMPKKNGCQVLDEIRLMQPDVKYLFSSGYAAEVISDKGNLEPGFSFLQKPAFPNQILSKVREILDGPASAMKG
jgi:two-component system cell cycle sensor histidine kinase/response regulator CckA